MKTRLNERDVEYRIDGPGGAEILLAADTDLTAGTA